MPDEAPPPDPGQPVPPAPPSPEIRKARKDARARFGPRPARPRNPDKTSVGDILMGTAVVVIAIGVVGAIAIPGLLSSQGARYSVRIEWERRAAEIDAAVEQTRKEGKLP